MLSHQYAGGLVGREGDVEGTEGDNEKKSDKSLRSWVS